MKKEVDNGSSMEELSLSEFSLDKNLGIGLPVVFIVKGTDQTERSTRLLSTFTAGDKFLGRKETRPFSDGFLFTTHLEKSIHVVKPTDWVKKIPEPRFIEFSKGRVIITGAENIRIIDEAGNEEVVDHPYFGSLHSAVVNPTGERLLVASTGFDSIIEVSLNNKQESWRWTAWENGFSKTPTGLYVTTDPKRFEFLEGNNEKVIYVDDVTKYQHFGLPTAHRTTHLNEAIYLENENDVLVTFFHQGYIVKISKDNKEYKIVLSGLKSPHGIKKLRNGYMVTDTRNGYWFQLNEDFTPVRRVSFQEMPGKKDGMESLEWIQYVSNVSDELFIAVDANRCAAFIFNPETKVYNKIEINPQWSVQSIRAVTNERLQQLTELNKLL